MSAREIRLNPQDSALIRSIGRINLTKYKHKRNSKTLYYYLLKMRWCFNYLWNIYTAKLRFNWKEKAANDSHISTLSKISFYVLFLGDTVDTYTANFVKYLSGFLWNVSYRS